ncbi:MAG: uroporphyrinogen-III synthase [Parachlamydiaceae bacterium]|nr:uroporphyrinogen-III synthase [Parachlamydiaceae bacterium]
MRKILYLGLEISKRWLEENQDAEIFHSPIIEINNRSLDDPTIVTSFSQFYKYTHILLTSKVAVRLFFTALSHFGLAREELVNKNIIVVGKGTEEAVIQRGAVVYKCATEESSEGIVKLLKPLNLAGAHFLWPCSALSRKIIPNFLKENEIPFCQMFLYNTLTTPCKTTLHKELPSADELVFTSPSTVDAFLETFETIPWHKKITAIGPITHSRLQKAKEEQLSCLPILL